MKKMFALSLLVTLFWFGCSKNDPVGGNDPVKGSISGVITDASTNAPIAGITITTNPVTASVTTNAAGSYTLSNVSEGTYAILIEGLVAYRETTVPGVKVGVSEDVTKNVKVSQLRWSASSTDNYSNTAIPLSINPLVAGSPIAIGDKIGVFYDSSGVTVCAGFGVWNGETTQISAWGDETLSSTTTKEGFAINEEMQWRIKRASDGKIFAAAVTYSQGNNKYQINQMNILQTLVAN